MRGTLCLVLFGLPACAEVLVSNAPDDPIISDIEVEALEPELSVEVDVQISIGAELLRAETSA